MTFAVPTGTVPLLALVGTPLALGEITGYEVTVAVTACPTAEDVKFGYATGKMLPVGIAYVGLTKVGI